MVCLDKDLTRMLGKFFQDGGWAVYDLDEALGEIEVFIKTAYSIDQAWLNGTLLTGGRKE